LREIKILLVGERLRYRSFKGGNKALPTLASCLTRGGYRNVVQLDLERPVIDSTEVRRAASDASLIAFAGCMTPQWPELDVTVRLLADHLQMISRRDVPIIIGGYATKGAEDIARLTPWISGFFNGEGEKGIVDIAQAVARGTFLDERRSIPGLCFVDADGRFSSSIAPRTTNFDHINQNFGFIHVPERHDMDIFRIDDRQAKTAQIFTQRGCPWICGFCNKSTETNGVVWLSEDAFRLQLKDLKAQGFSAVYLDVDTFTVNRLRARRQAEILHEEGFIWGSNTRVDRIDCALLEYLVRHGCCYMFCGVEHLNPGITLAIDKFHGSLAHRLACAKAYPEEVRQVYRMMRAVGLPSSLFLILGLPKAVLDEDETRVIGYVPATLDDDLEAVRFAIDECDPDFLNFNMLRFMPGSAAADTPGHPAYSCVRPSGVSPITAEHFLPRVVDEMNYLLPEYHGIFRVCESIGANQPRTTAVDPERVYQTFVHGVTLINNKIRDGGRRTGLFIDQEILDNDLVWQANDGSYGVAPLKAFEGLASPGC
jgi:radical SAM superfamily enzyme YgiQ (UPF0313 family)